MTAPEAPKSEIIIYQADDGKARIACRLQDDTLWLTQALIAELFEIGVGAVKHHTNEICAKEERSPEATIRRHRIVRTDGDRTRCRNKNLRRRARKHACTEQAPETRARRSSARPQRLRPRSLRSIASLLPLHLAVELRPAWQPAVEPTRRLTAHAVDHAVSNLRRRKATAR